MSVQPRDVSPTRDPARDQPLLDAAFMTRLERLELLSRKIFAGRMKGERRSKRKGQSVEFADYRPYVVGDDLRFLDWNAYGRLGQLIVKLFLEEEDLNVSILLDVSGSMDWGDPHKGRYIKQVAAALGYIGLGNLDRLSLYAYSDQIVSELVGLRGRRSTQQMVDFLERQPLAGGSNLAEVGKRFALQHRGGGICIVLSDFLDKRGYADGLRYLLSRKLDLYCIQVLAPDEIDPPLVGDLKLEDVEDGEVAEVSISKRLLERYKQTLQTYCATLKDYCTQRGMTYLFTSTRVAFDVLVLTYLRQQGLVR